MKNYVYILFSKRLDKFYVGYTNNLEKRLLTHNQGGKKFTTRGIPWILIKSYECQDISEAKKLEKKLKTEESKDFFKTIKYLGIWRSPRLRRDRPVSVSRLRRDGRLKL